MRSRIAIAAMAVLVPALVLAQKTTLDFDKTADFSKFRTYTLKDGTKVGDPLIGNRIIAAIEAELARTPTRWGGGWGTANVRVNEIRVGTLVVDVADAARQELVWRGMGVKEVDTQAKAEKRDKNISGAVAKIFKNYPPKEQA